MGTDIFQFCKTTSIFYYRHQVSLSKIL